jgi:hypothetical protein
MKSFDVRCATGSDPVNMEFLIADANLGLALLKLAQHDKASDRVMRAHKIYRIVRLLLEQTRLNAKQMMILGVKLNELEHALIAAGIKFE